MKLLLALIVGVASRLAVAAPAIPFKQETAPAAGLMGGSAIGVLLVSALAIVAVLVIRKRLNLNGLQPKGGQLLAVLETQRLGPRALLSVVEFEGVRYLIAQGEHGISCVASAPRGEDK